MNDRELLELAAKAAGMPAGDDYSESYGLYAVARGADGYDGWRYWNPLTDDGDALRLAVKLRITVMTCERDAVCDIPGSDVVLFQPYSGDEMAATRRAIVRAAAEIGRAMP